jgi:hypothetical protein
LVFEYCRQVKILGRYTITQNARMICREGWETLLMAQGFDGIKACCLARREITKNYANSS